MAWIFKYHDKTDDTSLTRVPEVSVTAPEGFSVTREHHMCQTALVWIIVNDKKMEEILAQFKLTPQDLTEVDLCEQYSFPLQFELLKLANFPAPALEMDRDEVEAAWAETPEKFKHLLGDPGKV